MSDKWPIPIEGGCGCGAIRYRLEKAPLFVHCCSCRHCQNETGSAFTLSVIIEADQVKLLSGKTGEISQPKLFLMPSDSQLGQLMARCPKCYTHTWSFYGGAGPVTMFLRAGTLDKTSIDGSSIEEVLKPDIFVYTKFKQPWMIFPDYAKTNDRVKEEFYDSNSVWPQQSLDRKERFKASVMDWFKQGLPWADHFEEFVDCR